jgi:hypothetical protein
MFGRHHVWSPESQKLLKDVLSIAEDVKIVLRNQKNFNIRFVVI